MIPKFWKSEKKDLSLPSMQVIERKEDREAAEAWARSVNFGRCYSAHKALEDSNLVPDAQPFAYQLKLDKIRQYQKQFKESLNHEIYGDEKAIDW